MKTSLTNDAIVQAVGGLEQWAKKCHEASVAFVYSDVAPRYARVARGSCKGVRAQHSWVVLGDPYDEYAEIIDLTLWSWVDQSPRLYRGTAEEIGRCHRPHGAGNIWSFGKPVRGDGETIEIDGLSENARCFLETIHPDGLDRAAWGVLLNSPVEGWPAKEIIERAYDHEKLGPLVPIDVAGMLTDLNPNGLYLRAAASDVSVDVSLTAQVREAVEGGHVRSLDELLCEDPALPADFLEDMLAFADDKSAHASEAEGLTGEFFTGDRWHHVQDILHGYAQRRQAEEKDAPVIAA